jgi:hypothetical protein
VPSQAEIEAAAKALTQGRWDWLPSNRQEDFKAEAEAALTAAEKERHPQDPQIADLLKSTARRCRSGKIPHSGDLEYMEHMAKAIEARTQSWEEASGQDREVQMARNREARTQPCCRHGFPDQACEPETGQPIPDEAVEAAGTGYDDYEPEGEDWHLDRVRAGLEAAAPIIRQQVLAEAKERVEGRGMRQASVGFHDGIRAALTAIDGIDDE